MSMTDFITLITFASALLAFGFKAGCVYSDLKHKRSRSSLPKDKRL